MTYYDDIRAYAPLPSGALPTDVELQHLVARTHRNQVNTMPSSPRRVFKP